MFNNTSEGRQVRSERRQKELSAAASPSASLSQRQINTLSSLLSHYKPLILHNLLQFPENNATDLQKLMQDQIEDVQDEGKFSPQFKEFVAMMAQQLHLSETLTVNLVLEAQQMHPERFIYDAQNTVIQVYFDERENVILSLLTLLQGRRVESAPQKLRQMLHEYVCELLRESTTSGGLVKVLTNAIQDSNRRVASGQMSTQNLGNAAQTTQAQSGFAFGQQSTAPSTTQSASVASAPLTDFYIIERQKLVECLFYVVYDFNLTEDEVDSIAKTLSQCIDLLKQPQSPEDNPLAYRALLKVVFVLALTLQSALDPYSSKYSRQADAHKPTKNTLYYNEDLSVNQLDTFFGDRMDKYFDSLADPNVPLTQQIQGFLLLQWAQCLQAVSEVLSSESVSQVDRAKKYRDLASKRFDKALDANVLTWLSDEFLTFAPLFEDDDDTLSEFCVHILSDLGISLIQHLSWKLEEIREYQIRAARHLAPLPHERYQQATEKFMKFISSIYYTNAQQAEHFLFECYDYVVKDMPQFFQSMSIPSEGIHTFSFVSYIQLLAALSKNGICAQEVFRLLKEAQSTTFEWNAFFNVIKQFRYQTPATQSRGSYAIVEVILDLISNVAENYPVSRPLFIQSSQWDFLDSLFAFVETPKISTELMGKVFTTMASFVSDQNVAYNFWNRLEFQQILGTQRQSQLIGGIRYQFTKVETPEKYYPETIGFLKLLAKLIHYVIPADLGIDTRVDVAPGITPYLDFVLKVVFNYFDAREYIVDAQKWEMTSICLSIFYDILHNYTMQAVDFQNQSVNVQTVEGTAQGAPRMRPVVRESHPGFQLMLAMLNLEDQHFTKNLLKIVCKYSTSKSLEENRHAAQSVYGTPSGLRAQSLVRYQSQGSAHLEKSILLSLKILTIMLERQDEFRSHGSGPNSRLQQVKLRPPEDLIKGDQLVKISEFIAYPHDAGIRMCAVKILALVSQINRHVVDLFIDARMHHHLMSMIISRLRGDVLDPVYLVSQVTEEDVRNAILDLLLLNAEAPAPNLTHFLCGVERKTQPISTNQVTIRTDDGHCLFAILQILSDRSSQHAHSKLVLKCYQLIYRLCSDRKICTAMLQYLERTNFFSTHLLHQHKWTARNQSLQDKVNRMHQRAFVLKIFALQIYVSTTYLTASVGSKAASSGVGLSDDQLGTVRNLVHILFQHSSYATAINTSHSSTMEQDRAEILEILHTIELTPISKPPLIQLPPQYPNVSTDDCIVEVPVDYIDSPLATSALAAASNTSKITVKHFDIQKLHNRLVDAKLLHQRMQGNVDTMSVDREIERILELAVRWNEYFQHLGAISHAFYAWTQVVGVAISKCYNMLAEDRRNLIVYDLLNTLLFKLITEDTTPAIRSSIASVVLRLTAKLREQSIQSVARLRLPTDQCLNLLRTLVETILLDTLTPATRGNLYAALLNYLQYTKVSDYALPFYNIQTSNREHLKHQYADLMSDFERQQDMYMRNQLLLDSKHQQLIERIAKDAIAQRGAWKTAAFSTLDLLMSYDVKGKWVRYLEQNHQVSLSVILQQYALLEQPLIDILKGEQTSLNSLYILESMASFLIRICHNRHLKPDTRYRILFSICDRCKFIDWIPVTAFKSSDVRGGELDDNFAVMEDGTTMRDTYHQVLIPVLQVLTALFSQEYENEKIARQVLQFLLTYRKTISSILKQSKQNLTKRALQEQRLVTTLFHLLSMKHHQLMWSMLKENYTKFESHMKMLLVELLDIYKKETPLRSYGKFDAEVEDSILDICRNIAGFLRHMCHSNDEVDFTVPSKVLFSVERHDRPMTTESIDALVSVIDVFTHRLQLLDDNIRQVDDQVAQLDTLGTQDLVSIAETDATSPGIKYALLGIQENKQHIRLIVQSIMNQRLSILVARVTKTLFILENSLLILWLHLNFFLQQDQSEGAMEDVDTFGGGMASSLSRLEQRSQQLPGVRSGSIHPLGEHRQNFVQKMNNRLRQSLDVLIEYQRTQKTHSLSQSSEFLSFMAYRVSSQLYQGERR